MTRDLLGCLLETAADSEGGLSKDGAYDEILSDVLLTLLFAGYDTTSVTLTYTLYQISQYPHIEALCLEEINSVPSLDQIDDFVYCRAVLQETLRLFPPAAATTQALQKVVRLRDGFTIPKGTNIFMPIWFIHRDERNFACPEEFRPDRWVHRDEASSKWKERDCDDKSGSIPAANRSAFFSFSGGARSCPGQKFAWQEAVVVLAGLLKNLKFSALPGYKLNPQRNGVVQHPAGGIPMVFSIRSPAD